MMDKLLFLDIDGVLNSKTWFHTQREITDGRIKEIDPSTVETLRIVISETGCKIVLSSSWRHHRDYITRLRGSGFPDDIDIIGRTPMNGGYRGVQIESYLQDMGLHLQFYDMQKLQTNCESIDLCNYAIVDDSSDMTFNQRYNFVCTPYEYGLREDTASELIRILNTPLWEMPYHTDWKKYR